MTPIPPDAKRYVIAAVVPCGQGYSECRDRAYRCEGCNGDGTRSVVTDIEVEPDDAVSGDTTVRVWLEVQP